MFTATQTVYGEKVYFDDTEKDFEKETTSDKKPMYWDYDGPLTEEIALIKYGYLARKYARQNTGSGAEYDDLVQVGYEGIINHFKGHENCRQLTRYFEIKLQGLIMDAAEDLRKQAAYDKSVAFDELLSKPEESIGFDWAERENAMFAKLKTMLSDEEMIIVTGLYEKKTLRLIAQDIQVSHVAILKRIKTIQKKLRPLIPWLEFMAEFKCTQE